MNHYQQRSQRTKWFMHDRFGMFIHWGIYSIAARGEKIRQYEKISKEDYQKYFDEFDPINYNAKEWAKLAKSTGMKYAVLTAKHHDGFCLFDSQYTQYKATNTKAKRDLVREYVDAFRSEGLKVGLYYSLIDWYHPDYPHYGDRFHPMRDNAAYKGATHNFENYLKFMHGQVEELLTNYGKIDIMWFDYSYDDMCAEKWEAEKLVKMMRQLQPDIIIDNRLIGDTNAAIDYTDKNMPIYAGDFESPEQIIPGEQPLDYKGRPVPWEACITMNSHWGYCLNDNDRISSENIIKTLVNCVSKSGNLLLNVGPDSKGLIDGQTVNVLTDVGQWMRRNSDSIYGCCASQFPKPEWGRYTQNGNTLYAHIYERGIGPIRFSGLEGKLKKARLLSCGSELELLRPWNAEKYPNDAFVKINCVGLPDDTDTVIQLELMEEYS